MAKIYTLPKSMTAEQKAALVTFAGQNGRTWKSALRDAWMTGKYSDYGAGDISAELQQLRNAEWFGPRGLICFRFSQGSH